MDSQFIVVGRVIAPLGVRGEMKVEVMTDFPERFSPQEEVHIDGRPMSIERSRWHKGIVILKLATIDSVEAVQGLMGRFLEVHQSQLRPLPEDEYYQFQLLGLEVLTTEGELLGRIAQILPTGSNDVYVVPSKDGELLIPAIEEVVKSVDIRKGCMIIEKIDGLLERKA
ncbi:MAG: 16S rRNA processing protein RimM [Dehalococcoidia bacterium]|nr:16S rRNA processing protein RimM [Dehalococcoidia bacterium]